MHSVLGSLTRSTARQTACQGELPTAAQVFTQMIKSGKTWSTLSTGPYWSTLKYYYLRTLSLNGIYNLILSNHLIYSTSIKRL